MTRKKHPANRFERLKIKEKIKQFGKGSTDRAGHVRRKLELETETVKELQDEVFREPIRIEEETHQESVERFYNLRS